MTAYTVIPDQVIDLVLKPAELEFRYLLDELYPGDVTAGELVALVTILRTAVERTRTRAMQPASLELVRKRGRTKR